MNLADLLALPLRYKPWRRRHMALILDGLRGVRGEPGPHGEHLAAAIDWLCRAQDVRDGHADAGGVSAGWSFEDGWLPSYPETTGYIIETFLAAAEHLQRPEYPPVSMPMRSQPCRPPTSISLPKGLAHAVSPYFHCGSPPGFLSACHPTHLLTPTHARSTVHFTLVF